MAMAMVATLGVGPVLADRATVLTRPETVRLKGVPDSTWVVDRSPEVKGEPGAVYRCSVEVESRLTSGGGGVTVRLIAENDQSITYQSVASVSPQPLAFTTHSSVFVAHERTRQLQVYYRLNRASGTASFRNMVLEKLNGDEADEALRAFAVPLVHFSLPVYCYSDETRIEWGYRVNRQLNPREPTISRLELACPGLGFGAHADPVDDQQIVHTVPWQLPEGSHTLRARALGESGKILAEGTTRIKSFARPVRREYLPIAKTAVDDRGNLLVNGEPMFPMGLYHVYTPEQMRQIRAQGFNCIQTWAGDLGRFEEQMDRAREAGLMGFAVTKMVADDRLVTLVRRLKTHPANLMWDLVDEPAIRNITPQRVQEKADIIRRIDPERPIKISFADRGRAVEYRDCLDIVACHVYPMPGGQVTAVSDAMQKLNASFGGTAPCHFTPQAWMAPGDLRRIEQTVAQTRAMTYLAIIHGAKGLYYYSFIDHGTWDIRTYPRLWSTFKGLTWEIETLSAPLLKGRRVTDMTASSPAIDLAAWDYEERRYVIAVNTSDEPVETRLQVPAFGELTACELFEPGRAAARGDSQFSRSFEPLATLVLRLTRVRAGR